MPERAGESGGAGEAAVDSNLRRRIPFGKSLHRSDDAFIDYASQPFEDVAHDMDVVFDTMGGDTFKRAFKTLKLGGFMVTVVAFPNGEAERYGVSVTRSFTVPSAQDLKAISDLAEKSKVIPLIDTALPLADVKEALSRSESGRARGKIVLRMIG